eukprot:3843216-Rhodomonas_salina.1
MDGRARTGTHAAVMQHMVVPGLPALGSGSLRLALLRPEMKLRTPARLTGPPPGFSLMIMRSTWHVCCQNPAPPDGLLLSPST